MRDGNYEDFAPALAGCSGELLRRSRTSVRAVQSVGMNATTVMAA